MFVLVYITAKNLKEAKNIAEILVKKRLVACANIVPKINSVYYWKGKLCSETEALILAKTVEVKAEEIIREVKKIHSYENPAISFIPIIKGSNEYFEWIKEMVEVGDE